MTFGSRERLECEVRAELRAGQSVLLLGPRGRGKTTVLRRLARAPEGAGVRPLWLDGRLVSSLADLYHALSRATLGGDRARDYDRLSAGGAQLLELVGHYRAFQDHALSEVEFVQRLYAFADRRPGWAVGDPTALDPAAPLAQALRPVEGEQALVLRPLLEALSALPPAELPRAVLGEQTPVAKKALPWLRFSLAQLDAAELLARMLGELQDEEAPWLLLVDEVQALVGTECDPFFEALGRAPSLRWALSADGLAGPLLSWVQAVGASHRHPFLPARSSQRLAVHFAGPLAQAEVAQWAQGRSSAAGLAGDEESWGLIWERTAGAPHAVELLLSRCLERARADRASRLTPARVEAAFQQLLEEQGPALDALLEGLAPPQRRLLRRLASADEPVAAPGGALEDLAQRFLVEPAPAGGWRLTDALLAARLRALEVPA